MVNQGPQVDSGIEIVKVSVKSSSGYLFFYRWLTVKSSDIKDGMVYQNNSEFMSTVVERIKEIPEGMIFDNESFVNMDDLKWIPENVTFKNGSYVSLNALKKIPESTIFENSGDLYLTGLEEIPRGLVFRNKGKVIFSILFNGKLKISLDDYEDSFQNVGSNGKLGNVELPDRIIFKDNLWNPVEDDGKVKMYKSWLNSIKSFF